MKIFVVLFKNGIKHGIKYGTRSENRGHKRRIENNEHWTPNAKCLEFQTWK